jgi:SH3 domain protein
MKKQTLIFLIVNTVILLAMSPCWAQRAYVTDSFEITLRTGPSTENKIVAMLSSGQAVEVLERRGDWSLVRVPDRSQEGWVVTRFLIERQPWSLQAASLKEENAALKTKLTQTESTFAEVQRQRAELAAELQKTSRILEATQSSYETLKQGADGFLKLQEVHDRSQKALEASRADLASLRKDYEQLQSSQTNRWFATGALVLLCGLLIGVMVGRQQKTRKPFFS